MCYLSKYVPLCDHSGTACGSIVCRVKCCLESEHPCSGKGGREEFVTSLASKREFPPPGLPCSISFSSLFLRITCLVISVTSQTRELHLVAEYYLVLALKSIDKHRGIYYFSISSPSLSPKTPFIIDMRIKRRGYMLPFLSIFRSFLPSVLYPQVIFA
jgi:hypothetical protein